MAKAAPQKDVTLSVTISGLQFVRICGALNLTPDDNESTEACEHFAEFAVEEFVEWMSGNRRYRSNTEMYAAWVEKIYGFALPNERPTVDHLYNNFNIPFGQAEYICRVLRNRDVVRWRNEALKELRTALTDAQGQVDELSKKKKPSVDDRISLQITRGALVELKLISDKLRKANQKFVIPSATAGFGDTTIVTISALSVKPILDFMDEHDLGK